MSAPRVVCVTWTDAHGNSFAVYEPHEIPHAPAIVKTYGVLMREDEAGVTIGHEVFENGGVRGITFVPKGMIREIVDVGSRRKRAPRGAAADPRRV